MTDEVKLLPCPFCGGETKMTEIDREERGVYYAPECGNVLCPVGPVLDIDLWKETKAEAITAWNHRTADARVDVEKLADDISDCFSGEGITIKLGKIKKLLRTALEGTNDD